MKVQHPSRSILPQNVVCIAEKLGFSSRAFVSTAWLLHKVLDGFDARSSLAQDDRLFTKIRMIKIYEAQVHSKEG
jgi:hypothetical protein